MPEDYKAYVREQVAMHLEYEGYVDDEMEIIFSHPCYEEALRWYWEDASAVCLWEGTVLFGRLRETGLLDPGFGKEGSPPFKPVSESAE